MNKKQFLLGLLLVCVFACKDATKTSDEHQSPKNESAIEQTGDEANFSSPLNKDEVVKKTKVVTDVKKVAKSETKTI